MFAGRKESWRRDPRAGALVIMAGIGLAGFLALVAAVLAAPAFVEFDAAVSAAIRDVDLPALVPLARFASAVGSFWPMTVLTLGTALILYRRGRRAEAVTLVIAVLGGMLAGEGLKLVFMRVRPALELARIAPPESYSFPSGHALTSLIYFGSLAFLALIEERRLRRAAAVVVACTAAAMSIALSRVYLGVHYFGDIVGSWLFGFAWLASVVLVAARWGAGRTNGEVSASD